MNLTKINSNANKDLRQFEDLKNQLMIKHVLCHGCIDGKIADLHALKDVRTYLLLSKKKINAKDRTPFCLEEEYVLQTIQDKIYRLLKNDKNIFSNFNSELIEYLKKSAKTPEELVKEEVVGCKYERMDKIQQHSLKTIVTLRQVYDNYVYRNRYEPIELEKRKKSQMQADTFYDVVRIPLPSFKSEADSYFKIWGNFMQGTLNFFDGKNFSPLFNEVFALENKIQSLAKNKSQYLEIFLDILREYELKAGYSETLTTIYGEDEQIECDRTKPIYKGVLTAEEFLGIISRGEAFDDFGGGVQHGIYSHRLQMYLLGNYFEKHPSQFFNIEELKNLKTYLEKQNVIFKTHDDFLRNIPCLFYKLIGDFSFNNAFEWEAFQKKKEKRKKKK